MMEREDMEKMIRSIVRKLRATYPDTEWDDLVSKGWEIVSEKIDGYEKGRGASLSTYLYPQVEGGLRKYIERYILKEHNMHGYRQHINTIPDIPIDSSMDAKIMLDQMVSLETGLYRDVLLCMIGGLTQAQTADKLKVSQQRISQILQSIREKYNEEE